MEPVMAAAERVIRAVPTPTTPADRGRRGGASSTHVDKAINKSRAFSPSINPTVNVSVVKTGGTAPATGRAGAAGMPGGDFLSNEDIRAFCEAGRKAARQSAVERALDAEMLEGRLRNIPDTSGSMSGARARARRVTRWLKRIAQAEKMIAKWYAALYSAFEREYEAELMRIGKGRQQQKPAQRFGWR